MLSNSSSRYLVAGMTRRFNSIIVPKSGFLQFSSTPTKPVDDKKPAAPAPATPPPPVAKPAAGAAAPPATDDGMSIVTQKRHKMGKQSNFMVFGKTDDQLPAPVLPQKVSELAVLDGADENHRTNMAGNPRTVVIRQGKKSSRQAPLNPESVWQIFFYEDGIITEKWENSLMGWVSNADPYQSHPQIYFETAEQAVQFVKKRGWNYVVKKPILRTARDDDAQYQDNFLPQAIASRIRMEGTSCDQWKRSSAGTSHYFRPLKYHGDGLVRQHGPNMKAPVAPHVDGYFKLR